MKRPAERRRGTLYARFVHIRTGHEHHEVVVIHAIANGKNEAAARASAWSKVGEIRKELEPLGYAVRWV